MTTATREQAAPPAAGSTDELFDRSDLKEFASADSEAAVNIGRMLVAFFLYSLIVVMMLTWWAFGYTTAPQVPETPAETSSPH